MSNPYFEGQYTNFFAAYIAAFVGFKLFERDGFFSFSTVFFVISTVIFGYILKITAKRFYTSIKTMESTFIFGIGKYIFELISCVVMCVFLIEMADMAKKIWKLRLF